MQKWKNGLQNWSYQIHSRIILDTSMYTYQIHSCIILGIYVSGSTYLSERIKKVTLDSFHPTGIIIFKLTDSTKKKRLSV